METKKIKRKYYFKERFGGCFPLSIPTLRCYFWQRMAATDLQALLDSHILHLPCRKSTLNATYQEPSDVWQENATQKGK